MLLLPSTSGGMRGVSEWVKKGEKGGGKGRDKTRGRAETAARSTCQETPETVLCRQMLCRLALCRPAKRSKLTNHFSLSCCEQWAKAHREIKTLHNTPLQWRKNKRREKNIRDRDGEILCASSPNLEKGRRVGMPPGLWQFCQITSADHKLMFKTWWPRRQEGSYGKMGWKDAGASSVRIDVLFLQHSWNGKNHPLLHRLLFLSTCLGEQFLWLNNLRYLHDLHKMMLALRRYDLEISSKDVVDLWVQ